jgi:hypothetical protein
MGNANRMQAEMIRFIGDRYSKDVKMMARFAECRKPEEFLKLQSELAAELAADYQEQGARLLALFGDASKQAWHEVPRLAKQNARPERPWPASAPFASIVRTPATHSLEQQVWRPIINASSQ